MQAVQTYGYPIGMFVDSGTFNGSDNGLRIKSYRGNGGNVRDITYSNISMQNVYNPIWISGYYPNIPSDSDPAQAVTATTPDYHDISVINMISTGSPTAGVIVGLPELPIANFLMKNVSISANTGLEIRNATIDTEGTVLSVNSGPGFIIQNNGNLTGLTSVKQRSLPSGFELEQNYPNPFNPTTTISYKLSALSSVTLKIYDVLGREVATLVDQNEPAGGHHVEFNGSRFASGIYYYRLNAGGLTGTKKLMLVK
ncbi:MAG: hypothetical protein B7Z63_01465 [Ignavibacteriae bacterium 37-53-5]|nr:MAG: hypothetical protein B7Z63_01465 [Ignavibacteriae bacterium 37-53-5]